MTPVRGSLDPQMVMTHRLKNAVLELSNWSKIYKKLPVQWVAII